MSSEIVVTRGHSLLLSEISAAAKETGPDTAAKLNALLDIKIRIEGIESEAEFWKAMQGCQNNMEPIRKDAVNPDNRSKYARVSTIQRIIQPIYREFGFTLTFTADDQPDANVVPLVCWVAHSGGHRKKYQLSAAIDNKGAKGGGTKTEVQGTMSTSSYLRRKLYELIFDLILTDDDDDGNLGKHKKPITQDQADTLDTLLNNIGMVTGKRDRFWKWSAVTKLSDFPAWRYEEAVTMLQETAKKEAK